MDEDDHEGMNGADLGISLSEVSLIQFKDVINDLHRGDMIEFKASL